MDYYNIIWYFKIIPTVFIVISLTIIYIITIQCKYKSISQYVKFMIDTIVLYYIYSINSNDNDLEYALTLTIENNDIRLFKWLLYNLHIDPNINKSSPLRIACESQNLSIISLLMQIPNINLCNKEIIPILIRHNNEKLNDLLLSDQTFCIFLLQNCDDISLLEFAKIKFFYKNPINKLVFSRQICIKP